MPARGFTNRVFEPTFKGEQSMVNAFMKKFFVCAAVLVLLCGRVGAEASHDVLAHGCGEWSWFARVGPSTTVNPIDSPQSGEQTEVFVRHNSPGEQWHPMPVLSGRAIALANRSSQLAVLMNDGQWYTLWSDGSATGQPLPGENQLPSMPPLCRMKTLADDGTDLWAIGSVRGGLPAAKAAIAAELAATRPSTVESASMPIVAAPQAGASSGSSIPLVLFRQQDGRWATVCELPGDTILASQDDLSLVVVDRVPIVAFRATDGGVGVIRYTKEHGWQANRSVPGSGKGLAQFQLISDGFRPMLWTATGNSPGQLYPDLTDPTPVPLQWKSTAQLDGLPTATFAGGYLCVLGLHDKKVWEQRYKDGTPFDSAAELIIPEENDAIVPHWFEAVLLGFMGFSFGANAYRQWSLAGNRVVEERPIPAPLHTRFAAGCIDAVPVIGALVYLSLQPDFSQFGLDLPPVKFLIILGAAIGVYILHTTLTEGFTARSIGKWLLGLRVVTIDGNVPAIGQLVTRNLLRVIDPLVMIVFTPLRQRSADAVAGTMVISAGTGTAGAADELKQSSADKTDPQ
jgi:uncharacterized RDD family membrane protein YckC